MSASLESMTAMEEAERALEAASEAYSRFDVDAIVAHVSTAVREFTIAGEPCRAAMACAQLGDAYASALGNRTAARAWYASARRLVAEQPACIEQGWIAVAALGCDVDDPAELLTAAQLALDRARQFGDVNLETKALADGGLAMVQTGRIVEGMAMLDEAMALACGTADSQDSVAKSVCSFFTACYHAADFGRAASWADSLRRHGLISLVPGPTLFLSSHCDSVQAAALLELGRWAEAEAILTRARSAFEAVMPFPSWHPELTLADLRIRQGRLAEAEAMLVSKDQFIEAHLPSARLHLARGHHDLACASARRGLRGLHDDRLRAAELLTVLVDAELARGNVSAASDASDDLTRRLGDLDVPLLNARAAAARSRVLASTGDHAASIALMEETVDRLDPQQLPALRATLLVDLARLRDQSGDREGAAIDAHAAVTALDSLDVVLPADDRALLERLTGAKPAGQPAVLARDGKWWTATCGTTSVRVADTKGLRYLAELIAHPGTERHALDLVDRVEGVSGEGLDRRTLGDAGPALDTHARATYRHRIESLRAEIDDALDSDHLETAEALQDEHDQLVRQLAQAFGLGGRDRPTASAAERARLNVTRAIRASIAKLVAALPAAGAALDRRVRTGIYCAYTPSSDDAIRWTTR